MKILIISSGDYGSPTTAHPTLLTLNVLVPDNTGEVLS